MRYRDTYMQKIRDKIMSQPLVIPARPTSGDFVRVTEKQSEHFGLVGQVGYVERKPYWDVDLYVPALALPREQKRINISYLEVTVISPLELLAEQAE